jgi:hypothetical protein
MEESGKHDTNYEALEMENSGVIQMKKRGHTCCGTCCDVRRAVIIVNLVSMCFLVLGLIGIAAFVNQDSVRLRVVNQLDDAGFRVAVCFTMMVQMIFYALGVYGAVTFNECYLRAALLTYVVMFVFDMVAFKRIAAIVHWLFAYPHYFLIKEIRAGIMNEGNYENEKYSCCCV